MFILVLLVLGCSCPPKPVPDIDPLIPQAGAHCPSVSVPDAQTRALDGTPLPADVEAAAAPHWEAIGAAMAQGDQDGINQGVCSLRVALGDWQGVAETAASYGAVDTTEVDPNAVLPQVLTLFESSVFDTEYEAWRSGSADGTAMSAPLRAPCMVIGHYLALQPHSDDLAESFETRARAGADWLLEVQHSSGVFPYPDLTDDASAWLSACVDDGNPEADCLEGMPRDYQLARTAMSDWQAAGSPDGILENGWFVSTALSDPGGLQFDTGICGGALLDAYQALGDPRYLDGAVRAGQWAAAEQTVPNWNYNAFSVGLLARLATVDTDGDWADRALAKAHLGVLPGAMETGRWADPHNARIVYHQILLLNLALLEEVANDPWLTDTLTAAAARSITEFTILGPTALDDGIPAHMALHRLGMDPTDTLSILLNEGTRNGGLQSGSVALWLGEALQ